MLGEANEEERLFVEEWINISIDNKKQFEDFKTIWEESKQLVMVSAVDENAAWQRLKSRIYQPKQTAIIKKMNPVKWWRVAAMFVLLIGASYLGYKLFNEKPIQ